MNIIEATKLMGPGKILRSEYGFIAVLDEDGMLVNYGNKDEPFGFFQEELLSEKWTVVDE